MSDGARQVKPLRELGDLWPGKERPARVFELEKVMDRLKRQVRDTRRSFVLVGRTGVGKTSLLQNLAWELTTTRFFPMNIVQTSTTDIVAGMKYIGEWQGQLMDLVNQAQFSQRHAIWFDDLILLTRVGRTDKNDENMAAVLTPMLEKQEILIFGEASPETYRSNIESMRTFSRQLDVIRLEAPPPDKMGRILRNVAHEVTEKIARRTSVVINWPAEAITRAADLGANFFPSVSPPAGAIRLIREAVDEKLIAAAAREYESLNDKPLDSIEIKPHKIVEALCEITGAPRKMLDDTIPLSIDETRTFFTDRLVGQRGPIEKVLDVITTIKSGLNRKESPISVLMFVGSTGVGKTEMARTLSEFLFGSPERMVRLDMSDFQESGSISKIIGHLNAEDPPGGLLARVEQQPFAVVLLDEIEKAHPAIFDLFLGMLSSGKMSRATGESVDFSQTIIIMTSNLGASSYVDKSIGFHDDNIVSLKESVEQEVQAFFRPEFFNRLNDTVYFGPLQWEEVRTLAQREIGSVLMRSGITRRKLQIDIDRGVIDIVAREGYVPRYGARPLKRAVEKLVVTPLSRMIAEMNPARMPVLIQLLPAGDKISLKPIYSNKRKTGENHAHTGVNGKKARPRDMKAIRASLGELYREISKLPGSGTDDSLRQKRSALIARSCLPNFWDDQAEARRAQSEIQRLDTQIEQVEGIQQKQLELDYEFQRLGPDTRQDILDSLADSIEECRRKATILRFVGVSSSELEQCDTILTMELIGSGDSEHLVTLYQSYGKWAASLGFDAEAIHEEVDDEGRLTQVYLRITGVTVYGMLAGEQGVHEFTKNVDEQSSLIKLTVMPIPEAEIDLDLVEIKAVNNRRNGKLIRHVKNDVTARLKSNGLQVKLNSGLGREESIQAACELLQCESWRLEQVNGHGEPEGYDIVRRWWLGNSPHVRDPRTDVNLKKIKQVIGGGINPFLIGWLEKQTGWQAPPPEKDEDVPF
ncbi:MAG: AAA family ATPase [bacterium]